MNLGGCLIEALAIIRLRRDPRTTIVYSFIKIVIGTPPQTAPRLKLVPSRFLGERDSKIMKRNTGRRDTGVATAGCSFNSVNFSRKDRETVLRAVVSLPRIRVPRGPILLFLFFYQAIIFFLFIRADLSQHDVFSPYPRAFAKLYAPGPFIHPQNPRLAPSCFIPLMLPPFPFFLTFFQRSFFYFSFLFLPFPSGTRIITFPLWKLSIHSRIFSLLTYFPLPFFLFFFYRCSLISPFSLIYVSPRAICSSVVCIQRPAGDSRASKKSPGIVLKQKKQPAASKPSRKGGFSASRTRGFPGKLCV